MFSSLRALPVRTQHTRTVIGIHAKKPWLHGFEHLSSTLRTYKRRRFGRAIHDRAYTSEKSGGSLAKVSRKRTTKRFLFVKSLKNSARVNWTGVSLRCMLIYTRLYFSERRLSSYLNELWIGFGMFTDCLNDLPVENIGQVSGTFLKPKSQNIWANQYHFKHFC